MILKRIKNYFIRRRVEKAMGFKLYKWQKAFIFYGEPIPESVNKERANGKTTASILRLLLSKGEPVIASTWGLKPEEWVGAGRDNSDNHTIFWTTPDERRTARILMWFNKELHRIQMILNENGVKTRTIIYSKGRQ